jgi:hypothetical protein
LIEAEGARLLREKRESPKSGGGLLSPDKHKMNGLRRRFFAFLDYLAYDLEGLAAGAGQSEKRRRLTDRPAESEHLERKSTSTHSFNNNKFL